jgi:hypothetical protein
LKNVLSTLQKERIRQNVEDGMRELVEGRELNDTQD